MRSGAPGAETFQSGSLKALILTALLSVFMFQLLRTVGLRAFSMASETYMSGTHSAAFVTCPNDTVAKDLSVTHETVLNIAYCFQLSPRGIVERKLAACVNIVPAIKSVYEWQGKIEEDNEVLLVSADSDLLKSTLELKLSNHPYEVAEVISLPIEQGNPPYLKWIGDVVPE
uniref:CutA divalent cation tolerance homolog n=1 Tax=Xiphophorus couchianus TaxID=32473 RepID=A0A3B5MP17_9TELE